MKFTTKCPKCGKVFNLDQKHDAQKAKCVCGEIFTVTSSPNKLPLYHNNQPDVDDMSESNSSTLKAIVFASVIVLIVVVLIFKFSFPDRKHKHEDNSDTLHETVAIQLAVEKHERNFQPETQRVAIDQLNCDQSNTQQTMAERNFKEQQEKERQKIAEEQQLKKQFPNIDLAWTNLPSNFTGHDIKSLYGAFSQKNIADIATKDKFETEEQYMERLKKSLPVHLLGELSTDSLLGFMLPKEKYGDRWEYAAEKQVYEYSFPMSDQKEWAGKAEIKIAEKKSDSKYYIGQNAFGVSIEVSKWNEDKYSIKVPIPARDRIKISIKMSPSEAKNVDGKLRLLYIVQPNPVPWPVDLKRCAALNILFDFNTKPHGFTSYRIEHRKPTIQMPYDVSEFHYTIPVEIIQVWVVTEDTGVILKKIKKVETDPSEKLKWHISHIPSFTNPMLESLQNVKYEIKINKPMPTATIKYERYLKEQKWTTYYRLNLSFENGKWILKNAQTYIDYEKPIRWDIEVPGEPGFSLIEDRDLGLNSDAWDLFWKYEEVGMDKFAF